MDKRYEVSGGVDTIRVGVVGVGKMGYHHARVYRELARDLGIEPVAIVDVDKARAREVARKYGYSEVYTDYTELRGRVDAASVAVPTSLHYKVAAYLASQGIHLLVEKPIADTVSNAWGIVRAAEKSGVVLMVGHIERYNPAVSFLKETVEQGLLGEIVALYAKRVGPMVLRISDVGVVIDLSVHDIDVMNYIVGEHPRRIYAQAGNVKHPGGVDDHAIIMLEYGSATGLIITNRLTPHKMRTLEAVGTKAVAQLNYIEQELSLYTDKWISRAKIEKEEPLKREIKHFIECIRTGKKPLTNGEEATKVLAEALAALESSTKRAPVTPRYT